jgi:hypothetical protein
MGRVVREQERWKWRPYRDSANFVRDLGAGSGQQVGTRRALFAT